MKRDEDGSAVAFILGANVCERGVCQSDLQFLSVTPHDA